MKRVTGIGGVFIKCDNKAKQLRWYERHLGIPGGDYGHSFLWREAEQPEEIGYTVWSPFAKDSKYFDPSTERVMINYRVADLESLLASLEKEGVTIVGEMAVEENGKFGWILDPEGNKIELWEPVPSASDPYL